MSAAQFILELDREVLKIEEDFRLFIKRVALEAFDRIIKRTPVDTGRARGNWFITVSPVAGGEVTEVADEDGGNTLARGLGALNGYEQRGDYEVITIYNNLPYILRLENGYSQKKAPAGMVAVTIAELEGALL